MNGWRQLSTATGTGSNCHPELRCSGDYRATRHIANAGGSNGPAAGLCLRLFDGRNDYSHSDEPNPRTADEYAMDASLGASVLFRPS